MRSPIIWICGLLLIIGSIYSVYYLYIHRSHDTSGITPTRQMLVDHHLFHIAIASTPAQQTKGLGGITSLGANQGMYFPLTGQTGVAFWMKDMLIPIDIIWIKQSAIVGIDANLSPPLPNTPDSHLTRYPSPVAQPDAVLEIAANQSRQLNLQVDDLITLLP